MNRSAQLMSSHLLIRNLALAAALVGCIPAAAAEQADASLEAAAAFVQADYRQREWTRLAASSRRDELIAALLIGAPNESQPALVSAPDTVEQRLRSRFRKDPLAMFALALVCQAAGTSCRNPDYQADLVRLAPDNTFHWLVAPVGSAFDGASLQQSAAAPISDSHARELTSIVRESLEDPSQDQVPSGVSAKRLTMFLRLELADKVPPPDFSGISALCKKPADTQKAKCITVGHHLMADASGLVVSRMVGSAMVRRLMKGTAEADAAMELRREYVWLSDNWGSDELQAREARQVDMIRVGEMAAWQRSLERSGLPAKPPVGWSPKDPRHMQLHEDRTPTTEK